MKMPEISVIVPVYNTEKWLRRCVDSILAQTFTGFELLLIDDGSTDGSPSICDEYAGKDSRIRVFHKSNEGVSSTRNLGIVNSVMVFLTFIDADDWVEPDYLENLLAGKGCDLSVCNYKIDGSDIVWNININDGIQNRNDIRVMFENGNFTGCSFLGPVYKLFKSAIIVRENLRFNEYISSGEDSLFVLEYFCHINNYYGTDKKLYHYWQPGGELSSHKKLANDFIHLAQETQRVAGTLQAKLQIDKNRFLVSFLWGAFNAYMKHEILQHKLTESQIDALFSVWGNDSYRQYVSVFGIPIRFSRLLYKKRLFHLFVLYLRILKRLNHPFFKTLG